MYGLKECSSCEALYNKSCGCSKGGFVDKFVRDPNKTPDSSQQPPHDCLKCGNLVDDFLNTSESSNDNTNIVIASQEPLVFNQDPGKNSSQSPPHINHHCCYVCGDLLGGIFCRRCTCESCGNGAHIGYNCPPKVPIISTPEPCHKQIVDEFPQTLTSFLPTCYSGDENSFAYDLTPNFVNVSPNVFNPPPQPPTDSYEFCRNDAHFSHDCPPQELAEYINTLSWNRPTFSNYDDDDDEDYTIAITPEEPDNSLSMRNEHLDTILATKSDEVIKSVCSFIMLMIEDLDLGSSTSECAEVYYKCMEPFKSLMFFWVRSKSIAAIWQEKVVTPLIEPTIKIEFRGISLTGFRSYIDCSQIEVSQSRQTRFKYFGRSFPSEIYRLISLALDSISALLLFGDRRLERTATFSISTISE
nr:hypothetical protein [Tanacetum cinerariifolium]